MEIEFTPRAKQELEEWRLAGKTKLLQKTRELITAILENPLEGIGKPGRLKYDLAGKMSRRISHADRLIYEISDEVLKVYSLKGHYE